MSKIFAETKDDGGRIKCRFCSKRLKGAWHWENHSCPGKNKEDRFQIKAFLKRMTVQKVLTT
jgi:hypothetical protein